MAEKPDHDQTYKDFNEVVNMTPSALETFLDTEDSKRVGWSESVRNACRTKVVRSTSLNVPICGRPEGP